MFLLFIHYYNSILLTVRRTAIDMALGGVWSIVDSIKSTFDRRGVAVHVVDLSSYR